MLLLWNEKYGTCLVFFFFNHVDLRRILTDYGFKGYPLRKEFPLSGFYEVHYDDSHKTISIGFLNFQQNFRVFI